MKQTPALIINQRLTLDGTANGNADMTGDYVAATDFYIQPPIGLLFHITSLVLFIEDEMIDDSSNYGGLNGPLINGIKFLVANPSGVIKDFTPVNPSKNNGELLGAGGRGGITAFSGNNVDTLVATFGPFVPSIDLEGFNEDKLIIRLQDDFTGLLIHRVSVFGNAESRG